MQRIEFDVTKAEIKYTAMLAIFNKYDTERNRNIGKRLNGKWSAIDKKVGLKGNEVEYGTVKGAQVSHRKYRKPNENNIAQM